MKIIHTADLHLGSPLSSRLPRDKSTKRRRELWETFIRTVDEAKRIGAEAFIIAGDLFDKEHATERELQNFVSTLGRAPDITFLYVSGNHEGDLLISSGVQLPENLHVFGKEWNSYTIGGVSFVARSDIKQGMLDELMLSPENKNIVILHAELKDKCDGDGTVGLCDLCGKNIDYVALGHYHSYEKREYERGRFAVYSGTPEGRGFDEAGEKGFVVIDTDGELTHSFVPFSKRSILLINIDITGIYSSHDIEKKISAALVGISKESIVRIRLSGHREPEVKYDTGYLTDALSSGFFFFEIKDETRLAIRADDYRYDKSLKGEFIRLCLDEGLDEKIRDEVISCGLLALAGETDGE